MKPATRKLFLVALLAAVPSCTLGGGGDDGTTDDSGDTGEPPAEEIDEWEQKLAEREVDYNAALRKAALKLTGDLPTLTEIQDVAQAGDLDAQKQVYDGIIAEYLERPSFARMAYLWWQDTLRLGDDPLFDQAAAFAAQMTFENRSYMELLTATSGQCGSFDADTGEFAAADCENGAPQHAGLLTHPAAMKQYYGNMAFRRVKWVQETFACTQFPAEISESPTDVGGLSPYTGSWPFETIPGTDSGGRIDFRDTSAVVCANCHTTMNHIAPLFAYFDENGQYQDSMAVPTPLEGSPLVELSDYLVSGETFAWRHGGAETPNLPALGAEMSADPAIAECGLARVWNWAFDKGDVVDALREVPTEVIAEHLAAFEAGEYRFRDAIYAVFTSEDFVRF